MAAPLPSTFGVFGRWCGLALIAVGCADAPIELPPPVDNSLPQDGLLCQPRQWTCISDEEQGLCGFDGMYWQSTKLCEPDEVCSTAAGNRCFVPICTPGETRCGSNALVQRCSPLGDRWVEDFACSGSYLCNAGKCTLASCLGHVLFVIDRSGSMEVHWDSVRRATKTVANSNIARFGLLGFPSNLNEACSASGDPQVPLTTAELDLKIDNFFKQLPVGNTPLVFTLERLRNTAPTIFGDQGGALVVLSDGADTCAPAPLSEPSYLATLARELDDQFGVKTYVVGYNFNGSGEQLTALAANGGTDYTDYIPAGTEQELESAFTAIVSDWKLCF